VGHHGGFADASDSTAASRSPSPRLSLRERRPAPVRGATVYSPLRRWVKPSMRVGVVGIGGLGHLALQFARAMGCEVTGDLVDAGTRRTRPAPSAPTASSRCASRRRSARRRSSLDFVLSTVSSPPTGTRSGALRPNGVLCLVGATSEPLSVQAFTSWAAEDRHRLRDRRPARDSGRCWPSRRRHGVAAKTQVRPLAKPTRALGDVRKGKARYRHRPRRLKHGPREARVDLSPDGLAGEGPVRRPFATAPSEGPVRRPRSKARFPVSGPLARGPYSG